MPRPAFHILETQGCDYAAWRLFLLSLLWRMDRSKLAELAPVGLGEARAEIQEMITAGDAGAPMDYPCWIYILALSEQQMREFMSTPSPRKPRKSNVRRSWRGEIAEQLVSDSNFGESQPADTMPA